MAQKQLKPSRKPKERNLDPLWLPRFSPPLQRPAWLQSARWRSIVQNQPVALAARDTLKSNYLALDWKIEPKDTTQRDELKQEIEYYTELFQTNNGNSTYEENADWIMSDLMDLPFGSMAEIGRQGDRPGGRVLWFEPVDGATLYPTLNDKFPVGQRVPESGQTNDVFFPKHTVNRIFWSPRTDIYNRGWGIAPPELVYMALEMLNRGDQYYTKFLTDTPEAGILDLGDMAEESAKEWVQAWREMLQGIDPYKIPVLYEHENAVQFLNFTRNPVELMFDKAVQRYSELVVAGYGMMLSDILPGGSSGGDTLAGSIRGERKTKRTGFARVKKAMTAFWNRMLPDTLKFVLIDLDEERVTNIGRARLASATAFGTMNDKRQLTPSEARQQLIADGLISISIPEEPPDESEFHDPFSGNMTERPNMLGRPVTPSQGGQGEVTARSIFGNILGCEDAHLRRLVFVASSSVEVGVSGVREKVGVVNPLLEEEGEALPELISKSQAASITSIKSLLRDETWWKPNYVDEIVERANQETLDAVKALIAQEAEELYVRGDVDKLVKEFDDLPEFDVREEITEVIDILPDIIAETITEELFFYFLDEKSIERVAEDIELIGNIRENMKRRAATYQNLMNSKIYDKIIETFEGENINATD